MKWIWEEIDVNRSAASGDLAKLFKHEEVKHPGVLALGVPSADATLMAREVIQNSWDSAMELQLHSGEAEVLPDFEISFKFRDLIGPEKERFISESALGELAERLSNLSRRDVGIGTHCCLDGLDKPSPIGIMEIRESATTGMYGPWVGKKSKMFLALVSVGFTEKEEGSGGSYGYGKAGMIRGSAIRTIFAYTCFRERGDDPGVTRRLLGVTYWGEHTLNQIDYGGTARMGESGNGAVKPLENEDADEMATRLGIAVRDPGSSSDLGTTFLLVEPTVEPKELCTAIERFWWPAIETNKFLVEIVDRDDTKYFPRPRRDPVLASFIRAHEVATEPQDNMVETEKRVKFRPFRLSDEISVELGVLGLVADPDDWSNPVPMEGDDPEMTEHASLVALIRQPAMVVEYFDAKFPAPYVRGAFVADKEVDDLLRQTEPRGHDSWDPRSSYDGIDENAPKVANEILKRVRENVRNFRNRLKPPVREHREINLPELERLFRDLLRNQQGSQFPRPPAVDRPLSITVADQQLEVVSDRDSSIRLRAVIKISLSDNYVVSDQARVRIRFRYAYVEDERAGESCDLLISHPSEFVPVPDRVGVFEGLLNRQPAAFEITSEAYHEDWTGRLEIVGDLLGRANGESPSE